MLIGTGKKARTTDDAWNIQETYEGKPHGWVQWKGTNVCMDLHCKCGAHCHIDDDFVYHWKCPHCSTVYMCNGHIEMIELEIEPKNCVKVPELDDSIGGVE
jgi:hypothetical protein